MKFSLFFLLHFTRHLMGDHQVNYEVEIDDEGPLAVHRYKR